jgi:hypothetical protein
MPGSTRIDYKYAPLAGLSPPTNDEGGPQTEASPQEPVPGVGAPAEAVAAAAAAAAAAGDGAVADRGSGGGGRGVGANVTMTPAVALAAKQAQQESGMVAWVVCAWQLSNISDFENMTKNWSGESIRCGTPPSVPMASATSGQLLVQLDVSIPQPTQHVPPLASHSKTRSCLCPPPPTPAATSSPRLPA